jgi:hypothetical protein
VEAEAGTGGGVCLEWLGAETTPRECDRPAPVRGAKRPARRPGANAAADDSAAGVAGEPAARALRQGKRSGGAEVRGKTRGLRGLRRSAKGAGSRAWLQVGGKRGLVGVHALEVGMGVIPLRWPLSHE